MIRLPGEIKGILGRLKEKDYKTYITGPCVVDALMGRKPLDWDLITDASPKEMKNILPESRGEDPVWTVDFTEEKKDGIVADIWVYRENPLEFLEAQEFTVWAMAENPELGFLDPYGGREDMSHKLVRAIGNPLEIFKRDPIAMMRAVAIAAENGWDIQGKTYKAMLACAHLLERADIGEIRENFCSILAAPYGGKGLRMLAGADLMPAIIGEVAKKLSRRQLEQFSQICDNLHKTKRNLLRRLGLFYTFLDGKKGEEAMMRLDYDHKTRQHILDGLYGMDKIHFFRTTVDLKDALAEYGPERYEYMDSLAKAQRIVYDTSDSKILMRKALMDDLMSRNDPIYVEDLAVDEQKLIGEGIPPEKAGEILVMLTDVVHRQPRDNNEKTLLKTARKFAKSKFFARTRKVKWLR